MVIVGSPSCLQRSVTPSITRKWFGRGIIEKGRGGYRGGQRKGRDYQSKSTYQESSQRPRKKTGLRVGSAIRKSLPWEQSLQVRPETTRYVFLPLFQSGEEECAEGKIDVRPGKHWNDPDLSSAVQDKVTKISCASAPHERFSKAELRHWPSPLLRRTQEIRNRRSWVAAEKPKAVSGRKAWSVREKQRMMIVGFWKPRKNRAEGKFLFF